MRLDFRCWLFWNLLCACVWVVVIAACCGYGGVYFGAFILGLRGLGGWLCDCGLDGWIWISLWSPACCCSFLVFSAFWVLVVGV